ncbi:hypothetical protein OROGR_017354 [Orobanche gracilis]
MLAGFSSFLQLPRKEASIISSFCSASCSQKVMEEEGAFNDFTAVAAASGEDMNFHIKAYYLLHGFLNTFMMVLFIYFAWFLPFGFAFRLDDHGDIGVMYIINHIVNAIFIIEIMLINLFSVAYIDSNNFNLVDAPLRIAIRVHVYMSLENIFRSLFSSSPLLDLHPLKGSCYQLDLLHFKDASTVASITAQLLFCKLEKNVNVNYPLLRCIKMIALLVTLFTIHWGGCVFYAIADKSSDPANSWIGSVYKDFKEFGIWKKYGISLYWSIATFTTTGFGDVHAQNSIEMLFSKIYTLVSFGVTMYIIANLSNLMVRWTIQTIQFRDALIALSGFALDNRDLPQGLKDQMLSYLKLERDEMQQEDIMKRMPKKIQDKVALEIYLPLVLKSKLFKDISNDFLSPLVKKMKPELCIKNEEITLYGQSQTDLFILISGAVDIILTSPAGGHVTETEQGYTFGEIGALYQRPEPHTVRTRVPSKIFRVSRESLVEAILAHYETGPAVRIMTNFHEMLPEGGHYPDPRTMAHIILHGAGIRQCVCRFCSAIVDSHKRIVRASP